MTTIAQKLKELILQASEVEAFRFQDAVSLFRAIGGKLDDIYLGDDVWSGVQLSCFDGSNVSLLVLDDATKRHCLTATDLHNKLDITEFCF